MLSTSIAHYFTYFNEEGTDEVQQFVQLFDKFFDCVNVRDDQQWRRKRKPDLKPYRSLDDERFEVSIFISHVSF